MLGQVVSRSLGISLNGLPNFMQSRQRGRALCELNDPMFETSAIVSGQILTFWAKIA